MKATHRVIDNKNNTIGIISDNKFYDFNTVKENIQIFSNIIIKNNNEIAETRNKLTEISYKDYLNNIVYNGINKKNPFIRDIQTELIAWKNRRKHKVLQLDGSRQIGKTTELKKFAYKNYDYVIYIDIVTDEYNFESVINANYTLEAFEEYCTKIHLPHFINDSNTILIIDEIQYSSRIYNSIKIIYNNLKCDIVITGSYLGRILNYKEFNDMTDIIEHISMTSMSFKEFCNIFKPEKSLMCIEENCKSNPINYKEMKELYDRYLSIGGYPKVVQQFICSKSIEKCYDTIRNMLITFREEARVYFKDIRELKIFEKVYNEALRQMIDDDFKAEEYISNILNTFAKDEPQSIIDNEEVSNAVIWLKYMGILCIDTLGIIDNTSTNTKIYFSDCGITSYLLNCYYVDKSIKNKLIAETFILNEVYRIFEKQN